MRPHRRRDHACDTLPVIQLDCLTWPNDYEALETHDNIFQTKSLICVGAKTGNAVATVARKGGAWHFAEEVAARWIISPAVSEDQPPD